MSTKNAKNIVIILFVVFLISGCNPINKIKIGEAYSKLKLNMKIEELNIMLGKFKLIKEQTILKYKPNIPENEMRYILKVEKSYKEIYPGDIFEKVTFDGNIKVLSYFIEKTPEWPYGWNIHYVLVFYDKQANKVVGWAKSYDNENIVKDWDERF